MKDSASGVAGAVDGGAEEAYGGAVRTLRRALGRGVSSVRREALGLRGCAERLAASDPHDLLVQAARTTPECPVYSHAVNTAVYALTVGRRLAFPDRTCEDLAYEALILDARLAARRGLEWNPSLPDQGLESDIHPRDSTGIHTFTAAVAEGLPGDLARLVAQDEAPAAPGGRQSHQGAQILAMADLLEGMTHPRSWRGFEPSSSALLGLLRLFRRSADVPIVRAFLEGVTLYPPGTMVALSNGEVGEVLRVRAESPNSPVVRIVAGADGRRLEAAFEVDLSQGGGQVHVTHGIGSDVRALKDPWLKAFLAARPWRPRARRVRNAPEGG